MIQYNETFLTFAVFAIALILMIINRKKFKIKKKMMIHILLLGWFYSFLVLFFMYIFASL